MSANTTEEFARVLHKFGEGYGLTSIERAVIISGVLDLTAQRNRALEAAEKLREAGGNLLPHVDCDQWPNECEAWDEALAATEPATVELPKCDHCGAIACGTDCDGSSHYTPEKKE